MATGSTGMDEPGADGGSGADAELQAGSLLISEVMANPPNLQDDLTLLQWVEIHNPTSAAVDMNGLEFRIGGGSAKVDDTLVVPAGGFILIGASDDPSENGGTAVVWDWSPIPGPALIPGDLAIVRSSDGLEIDTVVFSVPEFEYAESGWSYSLNPGSYDHVDNDSGANWCPAVSIWEGEPKATPGMTNNPCL